MPVAPSTYAPMHEVLKYTPPGTSWQNTWRGILLNIFPQRIDKYFRLLSCKQTFLEEWQERIIDLYKENNQKFMEETGLDLRQYHYPL